MQGKNQEKELKFALATVRDYQKLRDMLPNLQRVSYQTNYYFDTPSRLLAARRIMVRVREEEGEVSLCLKRNATVASAYFTAEELTFPLDRPTWEQVKRGELALSALSLLHRELGSLIQAEPLQLLGGIETERWYFRHDGGFCIELDRIRMPDAREEYEVEVETETPESVRPLLLSLFQEQGIRWAEQTQTK
ncbi:MAG: CYTH domain-containing protein, partial [Nitrospinota bacterium]